MIPSNIPSSTVSIGLKYCCAAGRRRKLLIGRKWSFLGCWRQETTGKYGRSMYESGHAGEEERVERVRTEGGRKRILQQKSQSLSYFVEQLFV
ncbi:unnamed protein product [Euphydryas editha]|uniref:Uncharacterized protein n=1 Tax=Euphydryas editha TaxID=104508 RepID=A0AAU9UUZ3_EUPED|nr:unnamed protein product [Euphydryas editha]